MELGEILNLLVLGVNVLNRAGSLTSTDCRVMNLAGREVIVKPGFDRRSVIE